MTTQHRKVGDRFDLIQDPATDTGVRLLTGPTIQGVGGTATGAVSMPFRVWSIGTDDVEVRMGGPTGPVISRHVAVEAAVNHVALVPAVAGAPARVEARGASAAIGLDLVPKGGASVHALGPLLADGPLTSPSLRRLLGSGTSYAPAVTSPYASLAIVGTPASTTPTVLDNYVFPAGTLSVGQIIRVSAIAGLAANSASKTLELVWDGQVIGQVGPTTASGTEAEIRVRIGRTSMGQTIRSWSRNGLVVPPRVDYGGTPDFSTALTLAVRGTGGGTASDVQLRELIVEMLG